uniref:Solute carrier family 25 member 17 n=1 Tax=Amphilophus citrinellus TaxID=61819 RepID=A0A3Q0SC72_AMPCI
MRVWFIACLGDAVAPKDLSFISFFVPPGVVNVLVTTPLWVVNTRLKLQGSKFRNEDIRPTTYSGILDAFVQIIRDEGVGSLWNGTFPSLLLVLNPAIQFMIYEGLKRKLRRGIPKELSSLEVFVIGAIAKAVATTVTYPLQTIQSILRVCLHHMLFTFKISRNYLYIQKYGMLGLFKGLEAKLLQTVLTAALMFLLYEKIASCTFRVMGLSNNHYKRR